MLPHCERTNMALVDNAVHATSIAEASGRPTAIFAHTKGSIVSGKPTALARATTLRFEESRNYGRPRSTPGPAYAKLHSLVRAKVTGELAVIDERSAQAKVEEGLTAYVTLTNDTDARSVSMVYPKVSAQVASLMRPDDVCSFAFPAVIRSRRAMAVIIALGDRVIVATADRKAGGVREIPIMQIKNIERQTVPRKPPVKLIHIAEHDGTETALVVAVDVDVRAVNIAFRDAMGLNAAGTSQPTVQAQPPSFGVPLGSPSGAVSAPGLEPIGSTATPTVSLSKGGNLSLTKQAPRLTEIVVGLGWDARTTDGAHFDLDASAFVLGSDGKVRSDQDFIFYNNLKSLDGSIEHLGDNVTGDAIGDNEWIKIDLAAVPADVDKIAIAVTIDQAEIRQQNFGQVAHAYVRVLSDVDGSAIARYDLGEDAGAETAIVFGEIYRNGSDWKFRAVGQGFTGGLGPLAASYGVST
jgi:tellurium resistance protein TerD